MFSFKLAESFIEPYKSRKVDWGLLDAGGNTLGEISFIRTYSRKKEDGSKETWADVCRRVVEGMFSIQKNHVKENKLPWNNVKAQKTAQDAFDRLFNFKWTPPGRGLFMMGTPLVMEQRNSTALQNCAFISTADMTREDPSFPFTFLAEASMYGTGVGFDQLGAKKNFKIFEPSDRVEDYVIPDTREGWVKSIGILLDSYLKPDKLQLKFDYSLIRPAGAPIKTFGGVAAGPDPLIRLHEALKTLFDHREGTLLTTTDIADIGNLIGVCVVSGNVRRSAELLMGSIDDEDFLNLKNYEGLGAKRPWGWMSNNSVSVNVGDDLSKIVPGIAANGEPGVVWMDLSRQYGRLEDPRNDKDHRVAGVNPCAEMNLESGEMCTLAETFIDRHTDLEDYKKTLKVAYLYAKTVTLLPTVWPKTNAIMQRNRRIGTSISGVTDFIDSKGVPEFRKWTSEGYAELGRLDVIYSEWLCLRESIKMSTIKPSGTVSLLSGSSPGVHWTPGGSYFLRSVRFSKEDPMALLLGNAGYTIETDVANPETTVVIYFPIKSGAKRSENEVTIFEKASVAALAQRYWSDNSVSVTISFDPESEAEQVGTVLSMYEGQLKTVSFLPAMKQGAYKQMPYGKLTEEEWNEWSYKLFEIDWDPIYSGLGMEAIGEQYCTTDKCLVTDFLKDAVEA